MHKMLRIICVVIGIALFGAAFYLGGNYLNPPKIVVVEDNNYHRENTDLSGSSANLVMLKGKIQPDEEDMIEDRDTGVTSKYPIMQRKIEMYQYFLEGDTAMMGWQDHPVKDFTDGEGQEWKNPPFYNDLDNRTFYHDFFLGDGDLPVSYEFLRKNLDKEKYSESFYYLNNLPQEYDLEGFEWKQDHYLKSGGRKNHVGDVRIYYKVLKYDDLPELTIIGQQLESKVSLTNEDCRFYDYDVTMDEIVKTYDQDAPHAALAAILFGTFFIVLGIFKGER